MSPKRALEECASRPKEAAGRPKDHAALPLPGSFSSRSGDKNPESGERRPPGSSPRTECASMRRRDVGKPLTPSARDPNVCPAMHARLMCCCSQARVTPGARVRALLDT